MRNWRARSNFTIFLGISPNTLFPAVGNDRRDFFACRFAGSAACCVALATPQNRPRPARTTQPRYHADPKASFQESCIA
jgi:hypothetical protein